MLNKSIRKILSDSKTQGWVMEPDAKQILKTIGISVPEFRVVQNWDDAVVAAEALGFPLVCKIVSPDVIHKSDVSGVMVGIDSLKRLKSAFNKLQKLDGYAGMFMEETASGIELIIGAKNDYQFGPVVLLGIGGTGVEIYKDTVIRMAPVSKDDIESMPSGLKAYEMLKGYRGLIPVNIFALTHLLEIFSSFVMEIETEFESIDLNPVMCSKDGCVVADARIILNAQA